MVKEAKVVELTRSEFAKALDATLVETATQHAADIETMRTLLADTMASIVRSFERHGAAVFGGVRYVRTGTALDVIDSLNPWQ